MTHTETKLALTPHTPVSCKEILQHNIAPFLPPFTKTDHGNFPSPQTGETGQAQSTLAVAFGAGGFFEGQMRLCGCKERKCYIARGHGRVSKQRN